MQRLKEERFMVVAGLLKRQRNECGRNRVLSIADRYRSIGCCFQLLYLFLLQLLVENKKKEFLTMLSARLVLRVCSQSLTTQLNVAVEAEIHHGGCLWWFGLRELSLILERG